MRDLRSSGGCGRRLDRHGLGGDLAPKLLLQRRSRCRGGLFDGGRFCQRGGLCGRGLHNGWLRNRSRGDVSRSGCGSNRGSSDWRGRDIGWRWGRRNRSGKARRHRGCHRCRRSQVLRNGRRRSVDRHGLALGSRFGGAAMFGEQRVDMFWRGFDHWRDDRNRCGGGRRDRFFCCVGSRVCQCPVRACGEATAGQQHADRGGHADATHCSPARVPRNHHQAPSRSCTTSAKRSANFLPFIRRNLPSDPAKGPPALCPMTTVRASKLGAN